MKSTNTYNSASSDLGLWASRYVWWQIWKPCELASQGFFLL